MPLSFKLYWAIHNATMTLSFVITIIYWGILHKSKSLITIDCGNCLIIYCWASATIGSMPVNATNVLTHACNSAIMFLDVLIVAHPIRLYHVYQPLAVGLIYLIFSVVFFLAGGTDKYALECIQNHTSARSPMYLTPISFSAQRWQSVHLYSPGLDETDRRHYHIRRHAGSGDRCAHRSDGHPEVACVRGKPIRCEEDQRRIAEHEFGGQRNRIGRQRWHRCGRFANAYLHGTGLGI